MILKYIFLELYTITYAHIYIIRYLISILSILSIMQICDFGLARMFFDQSRLHSSDTATVTTTTSTTTATTSNTYPPSRSRLHPMLPAMTSYVVTRWYRSPECIITKTSIPAPPPTTTTSTAAAARGSGAQPGCYSYSLDVWAVG